MKKEKGRIQNPKFSSFPIGSVQNVVLNQARTLDFSFPELGFTQKSGHSPPFPRQSGHTGPPLRHPSTLPCGKLLRVYHPSLHPSFTHPLHPSFTHLSLVGYGGS